MRMAEIMSSPVATVGPDESVGRALERMRIDGIHHLVVVDGKELIGVIGERDLSERQHAGERVGERVIPPPVVVGPRTTVREAANLLRGRLLGCLPIVENDKLVGVVTISDLLELLGRGAIQPSPTAKRWTLKHRGPRRKRQPRVGE